MIILVTSKLVIRNDHDRQSIVVGLVTPIFEVDRVGCFAAYLLGLLNELRDQTLKTSVFL